MKRVRATARITGLVQGVNFRYYTRLTAREHQVTGWVRNLADGGVEAVFEGREADVRQVLDWCRRGPDAARVDNLFIDWEDFRGEFISFDVIR